MNTKQFIQEYVEARGGKDALSEDEKKALVELAKKKGGRQIAFSSDATK